MIEGLSAVITGIITLSLFAATPSSTSFTLKSYDIGNGGGSGTSTNFSSDGTTGLVSGDAATSTNFTAQSGLTVNKNANVPPAPNFINPDNSYSRLLLTVNTGGNPTDTKYAIAISADNFATTQYVQSDNTVGAALSAEDYQTYSLWGGSSGVYVIGLTPNTAYKVKVKAMQGNFSETAYGPQATATTSQPSIVFSVETSDTVTPPYTVTFPALTGGNVVTSTQTIIANLTTNALSGGSIYIVGKNNGLSSTFSGQTIPTLTGDLSIATVGYGAQGVSTTYASGGPLTIDAPFVASGSNVVTSSISKIFTTTSPVTSAKGTLQLKAKSDVLTPAASDYTDVITMVAALSF
jgi:hypothetical protein